MSPNWLNVAGCHVLSTEGAKVSTMFDIRQHKRYFTDYRNQNIPKGGGGWGGDTIPVGGVMGKAPIVHNLK
jgi:hypothetical protein